MCLPSRRGFAPGSARRCEEWRLAHNLLRKQGRAVQLDSIDRAILEVLQQQGRISNQALAERVHLSASACLRRVKALEDGGVIAGYVALLNPKAVGQPGTSFTIINLDSTQPARLEAFEQAVRDTPQILDCFYVAGANDYLVRFTYRDAEDLERFHAEVLPRLPGVVRSNSMLVLRTVKRTTALAL
ncbi:MAG: Lrp/AsnC family transcriptional regulator [Betaproteobacteria bacterium]|nr:Lrp/AsnC family transcriptional regulator [Betaproteobacteria bacterium]